ncbi:MAG: hypothetical protein WA485_18755, partial [Candidatus Sulfotelmatobacter sp.]
NQPLAGEIEVGIVLRASHWRDSTSSRERVASLIAAGCALKTVQAAASGLKRNFHRSEPQRRIHGSLILLSRTRNKRSIPFFSTRQQLGMCV